MIGRLSPDRGGRSARGTTLKTDRELVQLDERAALLIEAGRVLSSSLDLDTTLENIAGLVVPTLADWCSIDVYPGDGTIEHLVVTSSDPRQGELRRRLEETRPTTQSGHPLEQQVLEGKTLLLKEITPEMIQEGDKPSEYRSALEALGMRSALIVPLKTGDDVPAVLNMVMTTSGRSFTEADVPLAEELARQCGLAIENARSLQHAHQSIRSYEDSLELLDAVFGSSPVGLAFIDTDLKYRFVNEQLARLDDRKVEDYIGRTVSEVAPGFAGDLEPIVRKLLAGETSTTELTVQGPSGVDGDDSHHSWMARYYPVQNTSGETIGIGAVVVDITERTRAEEARERSEQQLRLALDASRMGLWQYDVADGTVHWTHSAALLLGLDPLAPASIEAFRNAVHPAERDRLRASLETAFELTAPYEEEFRVVWPDGTTHWLLVKGHIQEAGPDRSDRIMVGVGLDVTERRMAQDAQAMLADRQARAGEQAVRMQRVTARLSESMTVDQVCEVVLTEASGVFGTGRSVVALLSEDGVHLEMHYTSGYSAEQRSRWETLSVNDGLPITEAVRTGAPVLATTRSDIVDAFPATREAVEITGTQAIAVFPLASHNRSFGAWALTWTEERDFEEGELIILLTLASQCAQALERARLYERERFISTALQRTLLPSRLPALPGATTACRYLPSAAGVRVGGDWYDVIPLPHNRVGIVMGDVGGHDIDAAAVMGQLRNAVRSYAWEGHPAAKVMEQTNKVLCGLEPGVLATCCYVELTLDDGIASVALAGHPPPLVVTASQSCFLEMAPDPPLGTDPEATYEQSSLFLGAGDSLVLYTDGLIESRALPVTAGLERLKKAAEHAPPNGVEDMADRLLATTAGEEQEDDIALLVLRYDPTISRGSTSTMRTVRRGLPASASSAGVARRFCADVLHDWGADELVEAVTLCVSELVTNSLIHTATDIELSMSLTPADVRVEIYDESDRMPVMKANRDEDTGGRGLHIVEASADSWGVEPSGSGKYVWFELSRSQPN